MRISSVHGHASFSYQTLLSKQKFKHKIKNFKMATIEHWSKDGVLLNAERWALGRLHAHEASRGRKALEMGGGLANATPTCPADSLTNVGPPPNEDHSSLWLRSILWAEDKHMEGIVSKAHGQVPWLESGSEECRGLISFCVWVAWELPETIKIGRR